MQHVKQVCAVMIAALAWWIFFIALMFLVWGPDPVLAHPSDDPCPPGVLVSFGCQVRAAHLGLEDPAMFALHKEFWHCRRELEGTLMQYSRCIGAVNFRRGQLGLPGLAGEPGCLTYHEQIPATPIVERPHDFENARAQIAACQANTCWTHVNACWEYLGTID